MSPHRIQNELRSGDRFATQPQMRNPHQHRGESPAPAMEPLQQESSPRLPILAHHEPVDDIYPAFRWPGLAAGRTRAASIHSIQTPQPEPQPPLGYGAD